MEAMKGTETIVDHSLREVKNHGTPAFPMAVYLDDFSHFQNGYICWHWHDEVQVTMIVEGDFICQVGTERVTMKPGDILFINSCALHQISPCTASFGKLYSFIWSPSLLASDEKSDIFQQCILPILNNTKKMYLYNEAHHDTAKIKSSLQQIVDFLRKKPEFYQLRIINLLTAVWLDLCNYSTGTLSENASSNAIIRQRDDERVKLAMEYMQQYYHEDLTLERIATATMISRSELCKCFQRALDITPKEFLLQYRINQSMILLKNHNLRISDIAEMTGFSSPSHFGSCFHKRVGCTPYQYRKNNPFFS